MRRIISACIHIILTVFCLTIIYGNASGQSAHYIEGSLSFTPSQVSGEVNIEIYEAGIAPDNLYIVRSADTESPFRFRIPIDLEMVFDQLYVNVVVMRPEGFACPYRNLRAHQSARLQRIPIWRVEDVYLNARRCLESSIKSSNDVEHNKKLYNQVQLWARTPDQVLIAALDFVDFLSKYRPERQSVVNTLNNVETHVQDSAYNIQERYWRTRRNAIMRLAGYNDFKELPLLQFAHTVGNLGDPNTRKTWTDFTISISRALTSNSLFSDRKKLSQNQIITLQIEMPDEQKVMDQIHILESILGPTIVE